MADYKYLVGIDPGHGGSDPGAVGYIKEAMANLTTALACKKYLLANGVGVIMSRIINIDNSLNATCRKFNKKKVDLAVSIHKNAGGGDGFEAYHSIHGGKGKTLAKNIENEVLKLGQNSRGLKTRKNDDGTNTDYYGFIRMTDMPAVILEGCFVDNKKDVKDFDEKKEQQELGYAYARGILKTLGVSDNGLTGKKQTVATGTADAYKKSLAGTYKTTADLHLRNDAGTNNRSLVKIPKGTKVNCYGYYSCPSGSKVKWYLIQTTVGKVKYTGFSSSKFLKK